MLNTLQQRVLGRCEGSHCLERLGQSREWEVPVIYPLLLIKAEIHNDGIPYGFNWLLYIYKSNTILPSSTANTHDQYLLIETFEGVIEHNHRSGHSSSYTTKGRASARAPARCACRPAPASSIETGPSRHSVHTAARDLVRAGAFVARPVITGDAPRADRRAHRVHEAGERPDAEQHQHAGPRCGEAERHTATIRCLRVQVKIDRNQL